MDREKYLEDTGGIVRIQTIELLDEIERLRKALEKYGLHLDDCDVYGNYGDELDPEICNCGLQQALKEKKCQSTKQ